MPHRADRKARIGEVEIFAADAEPPRNSPTPPESAINSKRVIRVGNSLSMISIGAILALL
jgi:hypothetical protein